MFDPILTHVQLIHCDNIFGEIILYPIVGPELSPDGVFIGQKIGDLNIQLLAALAANEINLPLPHPANGDSISPAQ